MMNIIVRPMVHAPAYYYCTWVSGRNKGHGYFLKAELAPQKP